MNKCSDLKNFILILSTLFFAHTIFSLNADEYRDSPYEFTPIVSQISDAKNEKKKKEIIINFINFFIRIEEGRVKEKNQLSQDNKISDELIVKYFALKKEFYISAFSSSEKLVNGNTVLGLLLEQINNILEKKATAQESNNMLMERIVASANAPLIGQPNVMPSVLEFDFPKCRDIYNNKVATVLMDSNILFDLKLSKLFPESNQTNLNIVLIEDQKNGLTSALMAARDFAKMDTRSNSQLDLGRIVSKYVHNLLNLLIKEYSKRKDAEIKKLSNEIDNQKLLKRQIESDMAFDELMSIEHCQKAKNKNKNKKGKNNKKTPKPKPIKMSALEKKIETQKRELEELQKAREKNAGNKGKQATPRAKKKKNAPQKLATPRDAGPKKEKGEGLNALLKMDDQEIKSTEPEEIKSESLIESKISVHPAEQDFYILRTSNDGSETIVPLKEAATNEILSLLSKPASESQINTYNVDQLKCAASSLAGAILADIGTLLDHYSNSPIAQANDVNRTFTIPIFESRERTLIIMGIIPGINSLKQGQKIHDDLWSIAAMIGGYKEQFQRMIVDMENHLVVPQTQELDIVSSDALGYVDSHGIWYPY